MTPQDPTQIQDPTQVPTPIPGAVPQLNPGVQNSPGIVAMQPNTSTAAPPQANPQGPRGYTFVPQADGTVQAWGPTGTDGSLTYLDTQSQAFAQSNWGYNPNAPTSQTGQTPTATPIPTTPPPATPIGTPVDLSTLTTGIAPTLPTATAPAAVSSYTDSVASTLTNQTAQLTAAYQAQQDSIQKQIDALTQKNTDLQTLQDNAMLSEGSTVQAETAAKQAALDAEMKQYTDNYNAINALATRAVALVDTATGLINQMRNTTGLASIMNPRISATAADLTAELAVINGAVNIYQGQIGAAQNQLASATSAITSIYKDQIDYYNNIITFYNDQQKTNLGQINNLTAEQQTYIKAQIGILSDQLANTQATARTITNAMLDPATALQYASAGVTLNDTPQQISQKLATYSLSQQRTNVANTMSTNGYSLTPQSGVQPTIITDAQGNQQAWYKVQTTTPQSTSIVNVGGRQVLINDITGATIQDLGPVTTTASSSGQTTLSPGDVRIDSSGNVVASNPTVTQQNAGAEAGSSTYTAADIAQLNANVAAAAKLGVTIPGPSTQTPTATVSTAKPTTSGTLTYTPADISQGQQLLEKSRGSDGYVDPNVYLQMYQAWVNGGGLLQDFLSKYPPKNYVNPANTWLPSFLMPAGSRKTTTSSSTTRTV